MAIMPSNWNSLGGTASNEKEFAGAGLALGVVTGARSFKIDKLGRLIGVNYEQVWTPFENLAECRKKTVASGGVVTSGLLTYSFEFTYAEPAKTKRAKTPASPAPAPEPDTNPHTMADCKCGFYGYYDGSDDFHRQGYVSGVIEGYGETLIGERGFRASKARIVALRIPKSIPAPLADAVRRNYAEIPQFEKFKAMVAAFPCDAALDSDPTDPDFWTRII